MTAARLTSAEVYDSVMAMPASLRTEFFTNLGKLNTLDYYNFVHTLTPSTPLILDGRLIPNPQLELEQNRDLIVTSGAFYPTVADVWKHLGHSPLSMTRSEFLASAQQGPKLDLAQQIIGYQPRAQRDPACDDVDSLLEQQFSVQEFHIARAFYQYQQGGRASIPFGGSTGGQPNAVAKSNGDLVYSDVSGQRSNVRTFANYRQWCLEPIYGSDEDDEEANPPPAEPQNCPVQDMAQSSGSHPIPTGSTYGSSSSGSEYSWGGVTVGSSSLDSVSWGCSPGG